MHAGSLRHASASSPLFAALVVGLVGCSSDSENDDAGGDAPCVKVTYVAADGTSEAEGSCVGYPTACANAGDPCGESGDECSDAIRALCEDGASRQVCVAASLNDRVTSVDVRCQRP
jgi:hypothetical protein